MIFKDKQHEEFYKTNILKTGTRNDVYHKALFYTLGLTAETRNNITTLYDFKERGIEHSRLHMGWQTGTSKKVTRLAFNLFNGTVFDSMEDFEKDNVSKRYAVDEIFCCGLAPYFYEAIKLRYPEYASAQ